MNLVAAIVHTASSLAVLIAGLVDVNVRTFRTHLVTVFHNESKDVGVAYLLPCVVLAGAISAIGHWFLFHRDVELSRINKIRWVDYALSSSLMIVVIALLSGVVDVWLLFLIAAMQSLLMLMSGFVETIIDEMSSRQLGPIAVMFGYHIAAVWGPVFAAYAQSNAPDFVIAIMTALFVLYLSFGVVYVIAATRRFEAATTEIMYIILSLVAKVMLQWLLYGGLSRKGDTVRIVIPLVITSGVILSFVFLRQ